MADKVRLYAGTHEGLVILQPSNSGWEEVSRTFPGAILDTITGCRQHPERVYLGAAHDGLYGTEDAGQHWTKLLDGDLRSVAVDPTNDDVVYAGTEPVHLYRSEDRGAHWEELTGLLELPEDVQLNWWFPQPPHLGHVRNVFVHPDDPQVIYLALEHGGIVRSFDRGETWEDVSKGIDYLDIHVIQALPHDLHRWFVSSARGFFTADEPAGGWSRAENGFTRDYFHDFIFLPPARAEEQPTMLIATADKSPGYWDRPELAQGALFRSTDGAQRWQRVGVGVGLPENMRAMVWGLANHPTDPNSAFAGLGEVSRGHAHGEAMGGGALMVTRDRGESWEPLSVRIPADRVVWAAAAD